MTNKALFLDRDGVINIDKGYVYQPKDIEWVPGVIEMMRRFQDANYRLIVVTNQSGIGRGYYCENDFHKLCEWMQGVLEKQGVTISDFFYCPHHPTQAKEPFLLECDCRKPAPGMILKAMDKWHISASESAIIGDSWTDIQAGLNANLKQCYYFSNTMTDEQKAFVKRQKTPIETVSDMALVYPDKQPLFNIR